MAPVKLGQLLEEYLRIEDHLGRLKRNTRKVLKQKQAYF
jgi:hypothetical protein